MKRSASESNAAYSAVKERTESEGLLNGSCSSNKRVKDANCIVDGVIVYTRKSKLNACAESCSSGGRIGRAGVVVGDGTDTGKALSLSELKEDRLFDVKLEDGVAVELAEIEERGDTNLFFGEGSGVNVGNVCCGERFGRVLRVEVEAVNCMTDGRREVVRDLGVVQEEVVRGLAVGDLSNFQECVIGQSSSNLQLSVIGESSDGQEIDRDMINGSLDEKGQIECGTLQKNLEMKMSKKIVLDQKPTTVRELFETGILEGVSVIYMGAKKAQGFGLRGVIKDDGIMCWCSLCRGSNVISLSQFEIHACKTYKRASQYICFENGKSLLDLLNACRDAPLHMLEATVQSIISCSPTEKYFNCRGCKGSFVASSFASGSLMCNSCLQTEEPRNNRVGRAKRKIRFSKSISISNSSRSTLTQNTSKSKRIRKLKSTLARPVTGKMTIGSSSVPISMQNKMHWRIIKKDQHSHSHVSEKGGLAEGTEWTYDTHGKKLVEGFKEGSGIICYRCNQEVSSSQSEAHADGEGHVHCGGCPRALHKECASLLSIPQGVWYCKYCENLFQRVKSVKDNVNALAAGRISQVHSIEQITQRCVRIFNNTEPEVNGCALCSCHDFSRSGFGPRTIIICDQCEQEYHVGCLREHKIAKLKEIPKGKWFCCIDCKRIHSTLSKLLVREAERIPDPFLTVVKKHEKSGLENANSFDMRWKLLNGNVLSPDSSVWLAETVAMFHESFDPIVDPATGNDLIPSIVNGKNTTGHEFGGLYCATLLVNSSVVSAGIIRIFGCEVAEIPLVATRKAYQHKGYFTLLFSCIEKLLAFLNVRFVVLPAAEEAESIWTEKFGFSKLKPDEVTSFRKRFWQMVTFTGTCMLQRVVSGGSLISEPVVAMDSCSSV